MLFFDFEPSPVPDPIHLWLMMLGDVRDFGIRFRKWVLSGG